MLVNFRQGIISAQTDQLFLNFAGNKININANQQSVDITFAYGPTDYLFSEAESVTGAWGPFSPSVNYWIYWDIDLRTGLRSFGSTTVQPASGATLPTSPQINQHFFDLTEKKMKVWNGISWDEKLRVFAAEITAGTVINPYSFGSQVGLSGSYSVGYILFDISGNPLTRSDNGVTYFVTTEDKVHTQYDNKNAYKIDGLLIDGVAMEPIPSYHCLSWKGPRQLGVTSYVTYQYPCVGISVEPSGTNELNQFVTKGFLTNFNNWNWTLPANTPLFVGDTGQITTDVPQRYSLQKIGHIVSPDTIFVDIQEIILIEDVPNIPSASPTPTITPSITRTPAVTVSPTTTASPTVTPSPTPSITPSAALATDNIYVSMFYANDSGEVTTTDTTLSTFANGSRTDIGAIPMSWDTDGTGNESIGNKYTRKLRGYVDGQGFMTTNISSVLTPEPSDNFRLSGLITPSSFTAPTTSPDIFTPVVSVVTSAEGTMPNYGYAINTETGYEVGILKYNNYQQYGAILVFKNGIQYTVTIDDSITSGSYNQIGMAGVDILADGTFFTIAYNNSEVSILAVVAMNLVDIDDENLTVTVQLVPTNAGPFNYPPPFGGDGNEFGPEIYETKYLDGTSYISMVQSVPVSRQSLNTSNDGSVPTKVPYIITYNADDGMTGTYYSTYDYSYYTITDGFFFQVMPDLNNTPFGAMLYAGSISPTATVNTQLATLTLPTTLMPAGDGRIRSVRLDDDNILIFTFGNGVYNYNISGTALTAVGTESGVYQDIQLVESDGVEPVVYNNKVIDTWVGVLHLGPPPTPSMTPTPSVTPSVTPPALLTDNYSPVILGDSPSHYWALRDNYVDSVGGISLTQRIAAQFVRDSYGNVINLPNNADGIQAMQLSSTVAVTGGSLEAWITPSEFSGYHTIFGDIRNGNYGLQFDSDGNLYLYNSSSNLVVIPTGTILVNNTYHLVVVFNTDNTVTAYLNGVLQAAPSGTLTPAYQIGYIGSDGDSENFYGKIGNPAIYSTRLTQAQVTAHYNAGKTGYRY